MTTYNKVTLDGTTLMDISDTTAIASDVAQGKYFYNASGQKVAGAASGGGSSKNIQVYSGYDETNQASYTATDVSLTVAKTGTYKVSWMGYRNTTSGTSGSQLYIGSTAHGTANTTFVRSYGQSVVLNNVSLTKDQVITVYARARNTNYYMGVGNLIIEEQ